MATKRVLAVNRRRFKARERLYYAIAPLCDLRPGVARAIMGLERAAIACGVEREKARRERERKAK